MAGLLVVAQTARELRERFNEDEIHQLIQWLVCEPGTSTGSRIAAGYHSSSEHAAAAVAKLRMWMSPALWSTLPDELLQLVVARLPLPKLSEMRSLSKQWNQRFSAGDPEFLKACSKASPRMVAMVVELDGAMNDRYEGRLFVRVFDTKANQWYSSVPRLGKHDIASMRAGDGGLVCTVPTVIHKYKCDLEVIVFNPLTGARRLLPTLHATRTLPPRMVQLVMDADYKHYKVILVGELDHAAHIYWSKTGVWSSASESFPSSLIFGSLFQWSDGPNRIHFVLEDEFHSTNNPMHRSGSAVLEGGGAYDCVGRQLHEFDIVKGNPGLREFDIKSNPFRKISVQSYALVKDHLFVLYIVPGHMTGYQLDLLEYQYQAQNGQPNWVKLRSHECGDISSDFLQDQVRVYNLKLYACSGFLLLKPSIRKRYNFRKPMPSWLYSLSTSKWQEMPPIPGLCGLSLFRDGYSEALFELRWDANP